MFALDLFNNDYERRLAEGAVDQLEQRRIDDLAMKMDDLVARAKTASTPEAKSALVKEFQKVKAERDSYFKIKDECMGYGGLGEENVNEGAMKDMLWDLSDRMDREQFIDYTTGEMGFDADEMAEFWDNIHGPMDEASIGQDVVNKTEKMARATPGTPNSKVASTVKNAAKWLAGKGGPGKEGPTYEGQEHNEDDYEQLLNAIAALYGPEIWDNDAMGDLANDLEQANPTPEELNFIIKHGKLPKRLQGIKFTNNDTTQFGEAAYTGDHDTDKKRIQQLMRKYHWSRQEAEEHLTSSESDHEKFDESLESDSINPNAKCRVCKTPYNKHFRFGPGGKIESTTVRGPCGRVPNDFPDLRQEAERKFPDPRKPYIKNGKTIGSILPNGKIYPLSKSDTVGADGMIYHWQDPRARSGTQQQSQNHQTQSGEKKYPNPRPADALELQLGHAALKYERLNKDNGMVYRHDDPRGYSADEVAKWPAPGSQLKKKSNPAIIKESWDMESWVEAYNTLVANGNNPDNSDPITYIQQLALKIKNSNMLNNHGFGSSVNHEIDQIADMYRLPFTQRTALRTAVKGAPTISRIKQHARQSQTGDVQYAQQSQSQAAQFAQQQEMSALQHQLTAQQLVQQAELDTADQKVLLSMDMDARHAIVAMKQDQMLEAKERLHKLQMDIDARSEREDIRDHELALAQAGYDNEINVINASAEGEYKKAKLEADYQIKVKELEHIENTAERKGRLDVLNTQKAKELAVIDAETNSKIKGLSAETDAESAQSNIRIRELFMKTFAPIWAVSVTAAQVAGESWQAGIANIKQALASLGKVVMPKAIEVDEAKDPNDPSGQKAIYQQGLEIPIASKYAGDGQFKLTINNKPAIVTVGGWEIDPHNPGNLDSFYLTDSTTGKTEHVTSGWNDPVAVAIYNNLDQNQKPALVDIYKEDMVFHKEHGWDARPDRLQGLPLSGYNAIPADRFIKAHKDMKRVTGQDLDEKKLGQLRPKLGSARDIGKSVKKFRAQRGLGETGSRVNKSTDPAQDRLLTRARREHPKARSDAEALAMRILDKETDDVNRLDHVNDREDRMIDKLSMLEKSLQQQIDNLKSAQDLDEGRMGEIDAMRQDLERMNERQFYTAYGISKAAFQQKYRTLLKPALDEGQQLHISDPIVVTAPNEFEGATGEIYEFSPSGKFVVVDLYNHGRHSMHLSDVEYNQYADDQDEEDDWYDDADEFGKPGSEFFSESANPKLDALIKNIQARVPATAVKRPEIMQRVAQMVQQADPAVPDAMATAQQLVQQYGQSPAPIQTDTSGLRKLKPGETHQGINAYNQALGQAPIYKANEGFQDFNKVEPYAVCLAGKPVKKFDYYEEARRFHDNWKQKLYREGDKAKADKITLMPLNLDEATNRHFGPKGAGTELARQIRANGDLEKFQKERNTPIKTSAEYVNRQANANPGDPVPPPFGTKVQVKKNKGVTEAGNPAQQAAIAISMQKAGKKPKQVDEAGTRDGALNTAQQLYKEIQAGKGKRQQHEIDLLQRQLNALVRKYQLRPDEYTASAGQQSQKQQRQQPPPPPPGGQQAGQQSANQQQGNWWQQQYEKHYGQNAQQQQQANPDNIWNPAWAAKQQAAYRQNNPPQPPPNPNGFPNPGDPNWAAKHMAASANMMQANQADLNKMMQSQMAAGPWNMPGAKMAAEEEVTEDTGSWIVYDPETRQIKKRFKTHTAGKSYARTHGLGFASSEFYFDRVKDNKEVAEIAPPGAKAERMVKHIKKAYSKDGKLTPKEKAIAYATTWKAHNDGKVEEAQTDYQKRRARERDVDAGRPVKPLPKNPQTDYARKRAKEKRDLELFGEDEVDDFVKAGGKITYGKPQKGPRRPGLSLASRHIGGGGDKMKPSRTGRAGAAVGGKPVGIKEESSTASEAVERAILNRIMVAHTDLLKQFGPQKVMQAAEEVAYNVGDVDEIGTSDVSAYVNQVKQILGA